MRLLEYEGKELLRRFGIPVPAGVFVGREDLDSLPATLPLPCVLKAQMLAGGRGKAGLIRPAGSAAEVRAVAAELLAREGVHGVLAEERVSIQRELFVAVALDRRQSRPVLMISAQGGVEVESAAEAITRCPFEDGQRWNFHRFIDLLLPLGLRGKTLVQAAQAVRSLGKLFFREEAFFAEINPLVIMEEGTVVALDAKVVVDDGALFRHPVRKGLQSFQLEQGGKLEQEARGLGLAYVSLPGGEVGVIAGGAGLAMATMDAVTLQGGRPGAFLDIGGGVAENAMAEGVRIVRETPGVRGVLINVFGGINNCRIMAQGIERDIRRQGSARVPVVVKTRGHFQEEGWAILERNGVAVVKFGTTAEAVERLLALMGKGGERDGDSH